MLIDAAGDANADLQLAADTFRQEIKENGGSQPLSRIAGVASAIALFTQTRHAPASLA